MEIVKVLDDAGADLTRTVLDHIDRAVREPRNRSQLAKMGCYLEYDLFGREGYYPLEQRVIDLPNDTQRCRYGGWGYAHILRNTVPVMRAKGVCEEMIHTIMVENPKRLLTLV